MSNRWKVAQWNDLARFVMTLDQAIGEILDPPLLSTLTDKGPDAVACHLYERLSQRGIHYTWERRSWGKEQEVRTPTEVMQTHQGTCLDLALQFAACLEAQFVHPIVVILDRHALVAFWKGYYGEENLPPVPRQTPSSGPAVLTAATVRDLLQRNQIVPVECTGFALFDRPVTLDRTSERKLRTRKFPLDDRPALPHAPVGVASDKFKLIAYPGAKSLGTTQIQNFPVQYGICIATARAWEIWPMEEREAGERTSSPRPRRTRRKQGEGQRPGQHIVGRQEEMALLEKVVTGALPPVVNIYGPGGIGKTVVYDKFGQECDTKSIPYATVTGTDSRLTLPLTIPQKRSLAIREMLSQFRDGLEPHVRVAVPGAFDEFARQCRNHEVVDELLTKSGGLTNLFTPAGQPLKPPLGPRWEFQAYIDRMERDLTDSFIESVTRVVEDGRINVVLLVDAYEMLTGLDEWMEPFVKELPPAVKIILLGRTRLNRQNHSWSEHAATLVYHELPPLSKQDAEAFLRYHGLDQQAIEAVYAFTHGYPLCLVLAVAAMRERGWQAVSGLTAGDEYQVASQLLDRILRQPGVEEVREFLDKGVVLEYFDPGLVSCVLDVSPAQGQAIYDKLQSNFSSFIHGHPQGLQFHEIVRDILVTRLRFPDDTLYDALRKQCATYLRSRAQGRATARPRTR